MGRPLLFVSLLLCLALLLNLLSPSSGNGQEEEIPQADGNKQDEHDSVTVTFRNELPSSVELYWEEGPPEEGARVLQGTVPGHGGEIHVASFPGHYFSYDYQNNERKYLQVPDGDDDNDKHPFLVLFHNDIQVRCMTTTHGGQKHNQILDILVKPKWSPRGACQFLDLIRTKYYDGTALNRVVPKFLTQFGISRSVQLRRQWQQRTILDDKPLLSVHFRPGMISYAGSGPDSRTTEIFVVMPDTPQGQLQYFGTNPWETPFAIVKGDIHDTPIPHWYAYGDMPPWGKGPDSSKIYEDNGYDYLAREFPNLDYIETCYILDDSQQDGDDTESEL